jgi:hypothetical protein
MKIYKERLWFKNKYTNIWCWISVVMGNCHNIRFPYCENWNKYIKLYKKNIPYVDKVLSIILPWEDSKILYICLDLWFNICTSIIWAWKINPKYHVKITHVRGHCKRNIQWHYYSQDNYWRQRTVQLSRQQ